MGRRTSGSAERGTRPGPGSRALGLVLVAAGVGVAVVHLVLAPTAYLLQRRARRGSERNGDASTTRR